MVQILLKEWRNSEDTLQRYNGENFDAWFQGNLVGNLGCQDFGRWLKLRGLEDGEEGGKLDDEDLFLTLQVKRKLPLQVDKEFPLWRLTTFGRWTGWNTPPLIFGK